MAKKSKKFPPNVVKDYLRFKGLKCPHCWSKNVFAGQFEVDGADVWQPVHCGDCFKYWTDIFKLVGIEPE